ncbi:cell division cycle-associated 7-like protein [Amphiura filiformis]|uniref:cell division cycle-associated 7-like protein n=1 Tax=Amphiura filiformis TaxID=82378 RepID=UPI003B228A5A
MAPRGKAGDGIMAGACAAPSIQEEAEATYEQMRQKNIEENKAMLKKLLSELNGMPGIPMLRKQVKRTPKKDKQTPVSGEARRRNPGRSARSTPNGKLAVKTRSMRLRKKQRKEELQVDVGEGEEGEEEVFSREPGQKLKIKFGLFGKRKAKSSDGNSDEDGSSNSDSDFEVYEDQELASPKKRRKVHTVRRSEPSAPRPVDDITQEELEMVADSVKDKEYDSTATGSTCHQCRQKTNDMKTVCRSGLCYGVRGQFCGPCLRNRYGEDARAALMDPNWSCPPCRGVCNCSFCRAKSGRRATGILIHLAKQSGYSNVMEYLQSFRLEKAEEEN